MLVFKIVTFEESAFDEEKKKRTQTLTKTIEELILCSASWILYNWCTS
jgi:hypothetical protein